MSFLLFVIDFNPRSHEGSDENHKNLLTFTHISIHAPTRGATKFVLIRLCCIKISIHAPTRGATVDVAETVRVYDISIHAPTRGATGVGGKINRGGIFQSTLPRGERHFHPADGSGAFQFQSTLPRGERPGIPSRSPPIF